MITFAIGDCVEQMKLLPAEHFQCCVTSPPYYGLRDYGVAGQLGLEPTPDEYVAGMVSVFREVWRVLRDDGVLFLNIGDSYNAYNGNRGASKSLSANINDALPALPKDAGLTWNGAKNKDLLGIPWMLAFALRADGWFLRSDIIWHKSNPMPESVRDRPTAAHEHVFLLTKRARYYYDADAVAEPTEYPVGTRKDVARGGFKGKGADLRGQTAFRAIRDTRNIRNVWMMATQPFSGSHFAVMPTALAERCVKAGSKAGDAILDPFGGAGTTAVAAEKLGRHTTLVELNPAYVALAKQRLGLPAGLEAEMDSLSGIVAAMGLLARDIAHLRAQLKKGIYVR